MLSTLAGAQITLAGLSFSITIVALTVASQQFGPRLMRNFMRDFGNQVVLGTFVSSFVYSVLVQGQIRGGDEATWVPSLSLAVAVAFALSSLGVLIYFIHHVSASIQASALIAAVGDEIDAAIDTLFPEQVGEEEEGDCDEQADLVTPVGGGHCIRGSRVGHLQAIDLEGLMALASERDLVVRLDCRPGDHLVAGSPVATVWPHGDDALEQAVNETLIVGRQRTSVQDLEYSIDQLVEIAVRALSPGINDPFTAMACADRLTASLCVLARRRTPSPMRRDEDGQLRLIARPWTFQGALGAAFDQIRQAARGNAAVSIRLVEVLALLADRARRSADLAAICRQASMIGRGSEALPEECDRVALLERAALVERAAQRSALSAIHRTGQDPSSDPDARRS